MTHPKPIRPRRATAPAVAAALAALLLAGCTSGHVGESWQCPLSGGGTCDSVAAADPAVPDIDAARNTVLAEPLWRVGDGEQSKAAAETACQTGCGGFDPFGWLARLLGPDREPEVETGDEGGTPSVAAPPPPAANRESRSAPGEPATAALPDASTAAGEDPRGGDLRTGEVIARIWIAPFVDGNGVYREASHVRAVLEPAGWRLP